MKKYSFFCVSLFIVLNSFSQSLEEDIYTTTEDFIKQSKPKNLKKLDARITVFETKIKTEDEYFAFINLIVNKAYYLTQTNQNKKAIITYEKAHFIYKNNKVLSYDIIEYCLIPLGILYHKTNAFVKAETIIRYYISLAKKQSNLQQQITGNINLASLYQSFNKHQSVITIIDNTLKNNIINPEQKQRLNRIKKESNYFLASDKKITLKDDIGFLNSKDLEDLNLRYKLALKAKDYTKAFNYHQKIEHIILNDKLASLRTLAKVSFQKSQLYYLLNQHQKALENLNYTLTILIPEYKKTQTIDKKFLYPENIFVDIFDLFAVIETNADQQLHYYNLSFYITDLLNLENTTDEDVIINASTKRNRSEKCIEILYKLYTNQKNTAFFQRAINYAEQHKASILKNRFQRKKILQRFGASDTTLVRENKLLKEQKQLRSVLLNTTKTTKQDSLRLRLIEISMSLKSLRKNLSKAYTLMDKKIITVHEMQSQLKENKSVITCYFYGKKAIYQFLISEENTIFEKIPLIEVNHKKIVDFINFFNDASKINFDVPAFTHSAFEIYKLLNFDAFANDKNIIIIPDGILNFIPFDALLNQKTNTSTFSKMPFLVKHQKLTYNTSLFLYFNNKKERSVDRVLGVFPVFENTDNELLYTENEAKKIKTKLDAKLLMRHEASKAAFMENSSNYSVLHLSTHATSGDFITPSKISFYDEDLLVNELYDLDLNPNLVVLSACETGVGKLIKGEGAMSIANGFQYAGAQNILFSLWQINDLSTSKIISSFYNHYSQGQSASFANAQSKIDYLNNNSISNAKKSPYYWSSFVFYGNSKALKTSKTTYFLSLLGIFTLVIIVFLTFNYFKKNAKQS